MENRFKTALACTVALAWAGTSLAAPIALTNTDFTVDSAGNNPSGWITEEAAGGGVSVQTEGTLGNVLTFQNRAGDHNVSQAIATSEATADTFGSWTVTFGDAGWRNYLASAPVFSGFTVSLIDLDNANTVLASDSVVLPAAGIDDDDIWQSLGAQVFSLNYDNTAAGLAGNQVAIVIESDAAGNAAQPWRPTAYIDNITVDAVPEPGSLALLGLGGLMMLQRRRRGD